MKLAQLAQKQVVVLGYGREGQATAQLISHYKNRTDVSVWVESGDSVRDQAVGTRFISRPFDEGLKRFDVAIRSPGIPVSHPALIDFQVAGGEVINPSSIFFSERPDVKVVGVTGSKGKSTTSSVLAHLINRSSQSALLAGNIGRPLVGLLDPTITSPTEQSAEVIVAELSSYQLCDLEGKLALSLITRLFPEHIDWHGSVEAYYASKMRMFELTRSQAVLVNARDPILMAEVDSRPSAIPVNPWPGEAGAALHRDETRVMCANEPWLRETDWPLAGRHNLDNAVMALSTLAYLGIDAQALAPTLGDFHGLPHRLERVDGPKGVSWINDSIATTPHATKAALESLEGHAIVLIVGGHERGGDWSVVIEHLKAWPLAGLVALPDNGAGVIETLTSHQVLDGRPVSLAKNMTEAVRYAHEMAQAPREGQTQEVVVLLSPGAPSFGHFQNFEHRGEAFTRAIEALRSDP